MLANTFEWLRAANLKPDNAAVESRQRIVTDLIAYFDKEADARLLTKFVVAACAGCKDRFVSDSPFIVKLVEATRKHQAAFPSNLAENALDLQVTCALVVGELLIRTAKPSDDIASAIASLVVSCLGLRTAAAGKFSVSFLSELLQAAKNWLNDHAKRARQRAEPEIAELEELEAPAELAEFWSEMSTQLATVLRTINDNAKADREELEVLWWFYNRNSKLAGKPISELSVNQAALVAAVEVADCVILPPHDGVIVMLADAVVSDRKAGDVNRRTVKTAVSDWPAPFESHLLPSSTEIGDVIIDGAAAFPISWICRRLKDSGQSASWTDEFEKKSGISAGFSMTPQLLTSQLFHERVAQRLLEQILKD